MWPGARARRRWTEIEEKFQPTVRQAAETLAARDNSKGLSDALKFIRTECHFEMNQIGTRLSWLLTAQTFLVSGAMIAIANSLNDRTHQPAVLSFLAALVSTVGLMISLRTFQIRRVEESR